MAQRARRWQRRFDPAHPTSLLYDRTPDGGWKLVGAMFTAPRSYTLEQLNERVPLSVARWHRHVNFCFPPRATIQQIRQQRAQNGQIKPEARQLFLQFFRINNQPACEQAGGRWVPQLFGWMVHVYPSLREPMASSPRRRSAARVNGAHQQNRITEPFRHSIPGTRSQRFVATPPFVRARLQPCHKPWIINAALVAGGNLLIAAQTPA